MAHLLVRWLILTIAVLIAAHFPFLGITYDSLWDVVEVALVLGIINAFVRPVLMLLSLPFIVVTLGFFILVVNALLLRFSAWLVGGFHVPGFWSALGASIIISAVSFFLGVRKRPKGKLRPPSGDGPVIDI